MASTAFLRQVTDSLAAWTAEKGKNEPAHAENSAIGANRFRIAFNAATGASVAKEWHLLSAVKNVDHGQIIG